MKQLNGSTELLAKAMKQVVSEAVEGGVEPLRNEIASMQERMATKEDIADVKADVAEVRAEMEEGIKRLETDIENGVAELRSSEPRRAVR